MSEPPKVISLADKKKTHPYDECLRMIQWCNLRFGRSPLSLLVGPAEYQAIEQYFMDARVMSHPINEGQLLVVNNVAIRPKSRPGIDMELDIACLRKLIKED